MDKREAAKRLFKHYMSFTWNEIGLSVDSDNYAEWSDFVDFVIDAAKEEMQEQNFHPYN
jgi:hypothetical protein